MAILKKITKTFSRPGRLALVRDLPRLSRALVRELRYKQLLRTEKAGAGQRIAEQLSRAENFAFKPLISIVIPTYKPNKLWLRECVDSVLAQSYPYFEICLSDDHSQDPELKEHFQALGASNKKIKIFFRTNNGHICQNTNSALALASGDYVAFLDHDDVLHPEALYWVAQALQEDPKAQFVYTDEDKLSEEGTRHEPHLKPAFDPSLLTQKMFTGHLSVYSKALVTELGGLRPGTEGAQDWDLILRATELYPTLRAVHIPKVLYHWRKHAGSTAQDLSSKDYARSAGERVVKEHLRRRALL